MARFVGDARLVGIAAAISAVALGLVYMALAGAPARLLAINAAALAIGLVLLVLMKLLAPVLRHARGPLLVGLSLLLLATAFGGITVEDATRWVSAAGLTIQPGLIVAPLLVTSYASRSDAWGATAIAIAIIAIALQPDRAVSAMLLLGLGAATLHRFDRKSLALCAAAAAGFAFTLMQPDKLPAVPYVDQILYTSFDVHVLAGFAVWAGVGCLLAPIFTRGAWSRTEVWAFAGVWVAALAAAALGNYPTPLVGYGASAIMGYLLALTPLTRTETAQAAREQVAMTNAEREADRGLHFA